MIWGRDAGSSIAIPIAMLCASLLGCPQRGTDPPVIEAVAGAASRIDPARNSLRIATINMWGVSALGFDWARHIDERFAALARRLGRNDRDLDFVLVQEAWKDAARRSFLDDPKVQAEFPYRVDAVEQPGGSGLVLLSAFPIEEARFLRFASQGDCWKVWEADCIAGKGVLAAKVRFGDEYVWVANTHLIACYAGAGQPKTSCDRGDDNAADRAAQLAELRGFLEPLAREAPVVVGGDFNFTRTSPQYRSLIPGAEAASPATATTAEAPATLAIETPVSDRAVRAEWTDPGDSQPNPNRIDYVFGLTAGPRRLQAIRPIEPILTDSVELDSGVGVRLSDHSALAAELCLTDARDGSGDPCARPRP
jgi:endonuclease/exonuclease/phosphatase family metal-dependent hydrolase